MQKLPFTLIFAATTLGCAGSFTQSNPSQFDVEIQNAPKMNVDPQIEKSSKAMHSFLVGQLAYGDENFEQALKSFSKASELMDSPEPALHVRLAELYLKEGKLKEALEESNKALESDPNQFKLLLLKAGILDSLKQFSDAEQIYVSLMEKRPESIDVPILLSALYLKSGRVAEAIALLEKAHEHVPDEVLVSIFLAHAYEERGDLEHAEKILQSVWLASHKGSEIGLDYVRILLKGQKNEAARKVCEEILAVEPENLLVRRVIGQIMIGENRLDDALKHLQELERLEDNSAETHFKIALIEIQKQNLKSAVNELNLVLAQEPEHEQARYYLASVYAASSRQKEALEELRKIKSDGEMFVKSRMFSAFLYRQGKDLANAEKVTREALKADPENLNVITYLFAILREAKKHNEALAFANDALKKDANSERLLYQRGVVLNDLKRTPEAIADMEKVVEINPRNSDALNYIAYGLLEENGDLERAVKLVKQALEIKANDGYYLDTLGWIYFKQGLFAEAEPLLEQAVSATEEDLVVVEHYGDCLAKLGRADKALEVFSQAIERSGNTLDLEEQEALSRIKRKISELSKSRTTMDSLKPLPASANYKKDK